MSKTGIADSCLILTNEQQMCINIIACLVLLIIIKLKVRWMLFLSYNQLTELLAHIFRKTVEGGVIPGQIIFILQIVSQCMKLNISKVLSNLLCRKYFPHMSLTMIFSKYLTVYLDTSNLSLLRKHFMKGNGLVQSYFPWTAQSYYNY